MLTSMAKSYQVLVQQDTTDNIDHIPDMINELKVLEQNNTAIMYQVEILRQHLENLVLLGNNFSDPEVLAASQALDEALNKLHRILYSNTDST
jgi:hypothetical protein